LRGIEAIGLVFDEKGQVQQYMQEHGEMPGGEDSELDDLF